jgi:hypothetical protein
MLRRWQFPPNAKVAVSSSIGSRVDAVSPRRNDFSPDLSLSSLTSLPRHIFAYVEPSLMHIETTY